MKKILLITLMAFCFSVPAFAAQETIDETTADLGGAFGNDFKLTMFSNWEKQANMNTELYGKITSSGSCSGDDLVITFADATTVTVTDACLTGEGGADSAAIHDDTAAEISAITEKASPVSADLLLIEDSEASNAKKRVQIGNLPGGSTVTDATITVTDVTTNNASTTSHGWALKATAPASGLINTLGIGNGETVYSMKPLFDATAPSTQAFGDSASAGTATVTARRDHKHAIPAAPTDATISTSAVATNDASTSKHGWLMMATAPDAGLRNILAIDNAETGYKNAALFDATSPSTQAFGDSAAVGSAMTAARRDHKHAMPATQISDTAYDATTWDAVTTAAPTKNAVRDYLESKIPSGGDGSYGLKIPANTTRTPAETSYELYPDGGAWKVNTNGTETFMMTASTGPVAVVGNVGGASQISVPNGTVNLTTGTMVVTDGAIGNASATSLSFGADPADSGALRLSNNTAIYWEAATPGTDIPIAVDGSNIIQMGQNAAGINFNSAPVTGLDLGNADTTIARSGSGGTITVEGVAVPTISSADTLTNKTLNTASTGNDITVPLNGLLDSSITTPADADDLIYARTQKALTITDIFCVAQGGGTVTLTLQECDNATCASPSTIEGAITCDADGAEDDATLTDGAIAAGAWIKVLFSAPSGTVNSLVWSVDGSQVW